MKLIYIIADNWAALVIGIILLAGIVVKLRSLWKGNIIEWLIDVCATMERAFGGGTGFLKLRGAYNEFIAAFPILSRLISFESFSVMVDEALAELKKNLAKNNKLSYYVEGDSNENCT